MICGYWTREPVPNTILRVPCASDSERYCSAIALSVRSDTHREYQFALENELEIFLHAVDLLLGKSSRNADVLGASVLKAGKVKVRMRMIDNSFFIDFTSFWLSLLYHIFRPKMKLGIINIFLGII